MGAWIEMLMSMCCVQSPSVAPFMGAWIEIAYADARYFLDSVAPFMGAWIEITWRLRLVRILTSLTFHGKKEC